MCVRVLYLYGLFALAAASVIQGADKGVRPGTTGTAYRKFKKLIQGNDIKQISAFLDERKTQVAWALSKVTSLPWCLAKEVADFLRLQPVPGGEAWWAATVVNRLDRDLSDSVVTMALERGFWPNPRVVRPRNDMQSYRMIHRAITNGAPPVVLDFLLAQHQWENLNESYLHLAAGLGHLKTGKALLRYREVGAMNTYLRTPLHAAVGGGHLAVAKELLRHGAKVGAKDKFEKTLIHLAERFKDPEMANFLRAQLNPGGSQ